MKKPPNILLITSDQQHHSLLGAVNPALRTPSLDRLAAQGMRFDRAYCPNPLCSPTRSSMITGQYPSAHGCWTLGTKLREDSPTVGRSLAAAGYRSTLVGKAHFQQNRSTPAYESIESPPLIHDLDFWRGFHGPWYGFDRVELARGHADEGLAGQHYAIWMEENGLPGWRDHFQPWPHDETLPPRKYAWSLPEKFHSNRWIEERSISLLRQAAAEGRPFFHWASYFDPHPPYLVPEPWASLYPPGEIDLAAFVPPHFDEMPEHYRLTQHPNPDFSIYDEPGGHHLHGFHSHLTDPAILRREIATYYGMMTFLDQSVGRLLSALDQLGLAENTLVVFTSDHGHFFGQHGLSAKGAFAYEDGIRVPFIVRHPGVTPAGTVSQSLQSLVDLPATFLALAGLEIPCYMQGLDQRPSWSDPAAAVRKWAIVENRHNPTKVHYRTFITARYKMTVHRDNPLGELFDLERDPSEQQNLWNAPSAAPLKARMMEQFLRSEIERETLSMPRLSIA